ncbi:hypothetical protein [Kitasatospora purpeofusca]|uniref:hypothetical protein n=1 Tax=Kitasatospora purpeofusca TaxID=67352 RepID=UPI002A5A55A8|nr:hypothetical protein [Kitasatospora purpeofusca]MDY0814524.1 hypothetical protein [Kitasatospora purpeofusca]
MLIAVFGAVPPVAAPAAVSPESRDAFEPPGDAPAEPLGDAPAEPLGATTAPHPPHRLLGIA